MFTDDGKPQSFLIKYRNEFHKTNWLTVGYCWCVGGSLFLLTLKFNEHYIFQNELKVLQNCKLYWQNFGSEKL